MAAGNTATRGGAESRTAVGALVVLTTKPGSVTLSRRARVATIKVAGSPLLCQRETLGGRSCRYE